MQLGYDHVLKCMTMYTAGHKSLNLWTSCSKERLFERRAILKHKCKTLRVSKGSWVTLEIKY